VVFSALFDNNEDSGSGSDMEVDDAPVVSAKSSAKSSTVLSKYAKKAAGFTDENAEWLTLKKEVRPFALIVSLSSSLMLNPNSE